MDKYWCIVCSIMATLLPLLQVVEDMEKDMRFSQNFFVVSPAFKL
jgi:hypothetical protein